MEQVSVVPSSQFPGEIKWKVLRWWQCSLPPSSLWKMKAWPNLKQNVKAGMSGWFLTWFVDDQQNYCCLPLSCFYERCLHPLGWGHVSFVPFLFSFTGLKIWVICRLIIFFQNTFGRFANYFISPSIRYIVWMMKTWCGLHPVFSNMFFRMLIITHIISFRRLLWGVNNK